MSGSSSCCCPPEPERHLYDPHCGHLVSLQLWQAQSGFAAAMYNPQLSHLAAMMSMLFTWSEGRSCNKGHGKPSNKMMSLCQKSTLQFVKTFQTQAKPSVCSQLCIWLTNKTIDREREIYIYIYKSKSMIFNICIGSYWIMILMEPGYVHFFSMPVRLDLQVSASAFLWRKNVWHTSVPCSLLFCYCGTISLPLTFHLARNL